MDKKVCTCAWCMGISPWREDWVQCIQQGWRNAAAAVNAGIACAVEQEIWETVSPGGSVYSGDRDYSVYGVRR